MKLVRSTVLSLVIACLGIAATLTPSDVAAGYCDTYPATPYLDGTGWNVVVEGSWACVGSFTEVRVDVRLLYKALSTDPYYSIVYTDSYVVKWNGSGSYWAAVSVTSCHGLYKVQMGILANDGSSDVNTSGARSLESCLLAPPASPSPVAAAS